jgi:hypothetical protein
VVLVPSGNIFRHVFEWFRFLKLNVTSAAKALTAMRTDEKMMLSPQMPLVPYLIALRVRQSLL